MMGPLALGHYLAAGGHDRGFGRSVETEQPSLPGPPSRRLLI